MELLFDSFDPLMRFFSNGIVTGQLPLQVLGTNKIELHRGEVIMKKFALFLICVVILSVGCGTNSVSISLAPSAAQAIDNTQSVNITATVTNDSASKGVTWSLSGSGALASPTATAVTYTAAGNGTATITATSVADATKTKALTITVTALPAITTASLPAGTEGTAYSQTVAVTGGAGTLAYSISVGSLPAGLSLNSSTGAITGTPTGPNGTANFTVKVTDSSTAAPQSATKALSILINLPPAPTITTASLPAGVEGTAYSQTLAGTCGLGPCTWSITVGSLPAGLGLNASTGAITGTPTGPNGTANFTMTLTDKSNPVQTATQALSILINLPPAPTITTASLPAGVEGTAYSQTLAGTCGLGPCTWSITVGSLPAGLGLNASTGALTGTPTGPNGTANFTMTLTDKSNPAQMVSKALSILINLPPAPTITTTSLPAGVEGSAYNQTLAGTCGLGPCTWSITVGSLPAGLGLNASTGAITGTPTGPNGTANFTMTLTDKSNPAQTATQALSILINLPPAPTITTTSLPGAVEFTAYNQTLAGTCGFGPCTWSISVGSLPAGLNLNTSTGAITGSPTGPNGTASFTVKFTDNSNPPQSVTQALSIVVSLPPAPVITTTLLPNGTVATPYNQTLGLSGGHGPFTWSIISGALPSPLTLNASTGAITGSPAGTGTSSFTVQVVDSSNPPQTAGQALSISVTLGPLVVTPATLPNGAVNEVYPATSLGATGGLPPYTWSISGGRDSHKFGLQH
jgi:large repetitive protein